MSWSIAEMVNEVQISQACALELFETYGDGLWDGEESVTCTGRLYFNPDHSEWMDYLGNASYDLVVEILKKHKVKGDICFGSLEGDNAGSFWGYRFDGQGGMKKLRGTVAWQENRESLMGKIFVLTGELDSMTRVQAIKKIGELGGVVSNSISKKVDYIVVGNKPGSKLGRARELGIPCIMQAEFEKILKG